MSAKRVGRQAMNRASADVRKPCNVERCAALRCISCCKLPLSLSCDGSELRRAYQPWEVLMYLQRWADPPGAASAC